MVGLSNHAVTYVNRDDKNFVWYILSMNVIHSKPESTIQLSTVVKKAIATDLVITNPFDYPVKYDISIEGSGLMGDRELSIPEKSEKTYTFTYAPCKISALFNTSFHNMFFIVLSGSSTGKLVFKNENVGEFWFELKLESKESDTITLESMTAPLGKYSVRKITIL
jgi:hypothetical protein